MRVKFENCEVELWKVRQGVVVAGAGHVGHITKIARPNTITTENVYTIDMTTHGVDVYLMSDGVTWLEPH